MWGRAGSTLGLTTQVMMKFVSGISIPTTVRKPIERYALGTDSSPDIYSPSAKHTLSKPSNNYPSIRVAKCLIFFCLQTGNDSSLNEAFTHFIY